MATPNPRDVLRVPGRLSASPTDLTTAYPHGGTALGVVKHIVFRPNAQYVEGMIVTAEEYGGEMVEALQGPEGAVLGAVLSSWDDDAVAQIFPNSATGATTGNVFTTAPGSNRAGSLLSGRAVPIMFTPLDEENLPSLILYRAVPSIEESAALSLTLGDEFGLGLIFAGIRNTSGNLWTMGLKRDISLT